MAWMTAAAVAAALRRSGALLGSSSLRAPAAPRGSALLHGAAPPHGPGPHLPGPYRFERPRHCIRGNSGPPTPDEEESRKINEELELMDQEELREYAKKVTQKNQKLQDLLSRSQCNVDRSEMKIMRQDITANKVTIDNMLKTAEKRKDATSVCIPGVGSVNVLALSMFFLKVFETVGDKVDKIF